MYLFADNISVLKKSICLCKITSNIYNSMYFKNVIGLGINKCSQLLSIPMYNHFFLDMLKISVLKLELKYIQTLLLSNSMPSLT